MKRILIVCLVLCAAGRSAVALDMKTFFSEQGDKWNILRNEKGFIRSLYGQGSKSYASPANAAEQLLAKHAALFGIQKPSDLKIAWIEETDAGTDFFYRQYYRGLPVAGAFVALHLDRYNRIVGATSEYKRNMHGTFRIADSLESARNTAQRLVKNGAPEETGTLMILDGGEGQAMPVWKIAVDSRHISSGSWQVYVNALKPNFAYFLQRTFLDLNGTGNIWDENPVVTPQRAERTFKYMDDSRKLFGKFARVFDANFIHTVFRFPLDLSIYTTAFDQNRRYDFAEGDARLTEAMAYFHINRARDSWKKFGFRKLNGKAPIFVNVARAENGEGYDNAFYTRNSKFRKTGIYVFGAGHSFENLGLDGDVYYHEYGHGVLDHTKPHFLEAIETNYPGAFHEAFGDISAGAISQNSKLAEFALRLKSNHKFVGRNLNNNRRFPQDVIRPGFGASESHYTGQIAGGAWWDVAQTIGITEAQKILFKSLRLLPVKEIDFFDVRNAMLTADAGLNGATNQTAILNAFSRHGLGGDDPGQPGTVNITALKTGRYNFNTNRIRITSAFKKGDTIAAVLSYNTTSNLLPGYNLIPVDVAFEGACDSCVFLATVTDEARKGSFSNASGALQVLLFTDTAAAGQYTLTLRTRLGGTDQISSTQTAHFKIR